MKIGIIGTRGIPNNYGGFEQFAEYLSKGLVEKNCEVFVYNSHNHPYKQKKWGKVNIIHKYDPEYLIGFSGQFFYDFNCIIDSRRRKFDIILQLGYTTNSIWHLFLPRKGKKICNPDGMEWKRAKYPKIIKKFLKYAEKLAVRSNDVLIADSEVIKKYYIEKYNKETYFVAYPAIIFKKPNEKIVQKFDVEIYKYNILIARLQEDNNVETIIKGVVNSDSDLPLLVIGNNDTKYGNYLKDRYTDKRIIFLGAIYDANILNNLRFYSAIYFHGHSAGGTNPSLLEAMSSSALICANDNPYNISVLNKNAFYFKNDADISKLLNKKLQKLDYKDFINANLQKIEQKYSLKKIIDEYYDIFVK